MVWTSCWGERMHKHSSVRALLWSFKTTRTRLRSASPAARRRRLAVLIPTAGLFAGNLAIGVCSAHADSGLTPGSLVGGVTFSQDCPSGIGGGIAYDGQYLWYSGYASSTDLLRAHPLTGQASASVHIAGGVS